MASSPFVDSSSAASLVAERLVLVEELLDIAERAQTHTRAAGSAVALQCGKLFVVRTSTGVAPEVGASLPCDQGVIGQCGSKPYSGTPAEGEMDAALRPLGVRSLIAVPVLQDRSRLGVLFVTAQTPEAFSRMHVAILMTMAGQAAAVLKRLEAVTNGESAAAAPELPQPEAGAQAPASPVTQPQNIVETLKQIEQKPAPPMKLLIDKPVSAISAPRIVVPDHQAALRVAAVSSIDVDATHQSAEGLTADVPAKPLPDLLAPGEDPRKYGTLKNVKEPQRREIIVDTVYHRPPPLEPRTSKTPFFVAAATVIVAVFGFGVWHRAKTPAEAAAPVAVQPAAAAQPARLVAVPISAPSVQPVAAKEPARAAAPVEKENTAKTEDPAEPAIEKPAILIASAHRTKPEVTQVDAPHLNFASGAALPELSAPRVATPSLAAKRSVATPSVAIRTVAPVYPEVARRDSISGDVHMQLTVSSMGKVTDVRVLSGLPLLRQAATTAVRQWVYRPATLDGRPVDSTVDVVVKFAQR